MFSTFYTSTQLQSLGAENNCILIKPQNKPIRAADLFLSSNFKVPSANVSNSKVYFSNHIKITPSIFVCEADLEVLMLFVSQLVSRNVENKGMVTW